MGTIVRTTALAFLMFYQINTLAEVNTTGSTVDNNGNIIVIGYCLGNVRIAGQEHTITQPSVYILKLNPEGEFIWVKFAKSNGSVKANAVSVDSFGSIYITGEFSGTVGFDSYSLTATTTDAFIAKYNHAGEVNWVKHGTSAGTANGNDIFVNNNLVFVCGYGKPITFDTLSITGGGFTVIYNSEGSIVNLFQTRDISYRLNVNADNDLIILGGEYIPWPVPYYNYSVSKYFQDGNFVWAAMNDFSTSNSLCSDNNKNIYTTGNRVRLTKHDNEGNALILKTLTMAEGNRGRIIKIKDQTHILLAGYYSTGFTFGDSILQSKGLTDFFIAVVDTNLNPIWINHGGGSYDDELNSVSIQNNGSIICGGNFRGIITIDTFQIAGGTSADDKWAGITKFDPEGNFILVKKVVEQFTPSSTANWFPLEVGTKFHYSENRSDGYFSDYYLREFRVTDSVHINNKKYFSVDGFYGFNPGTKIRYDQESQQILVVYNNQEYLFMDFSKVAGETFQQTNGSGGYKNATIISQNLVILEDTVEAKGFYHVTRWVGPLTTSEVATWSYFSPERGWVFQDQEWYMSPITVADLVIIEYLLTNDGQINHKKHTESATINFNSVVFIPEGDSLYQNFIVLHPFSKQNVPASHGYFSYMNAYLQSFYFNGSDTLWNSEFQIQQTTEKDFTLNYQFDTTKYNQGYHLYYRIAAVDKGIVADTFYSPPTGFYKLFWRDSTTSVNQLSPGVFDYSLSQNYPNPFNPSTKISFSIPEREFVSIKVFDILGEEVATIVKEELDAGRYEVDFDGKSLSSGIYIYRITGGNYTSTKKMILMK